MQLTFLKGASPDYAPSKKFAVQNNRIEKISGYSAGYMFFHNLVVQPEDLNVIAQTLRNYAAAGWFRINGKPTDELTSNPSKAVRRLIENFPEHDTKFASFDIDDLEIDPALIAKHRWQLHEPETTASLVRDLLTREGLTSLAMSDFIVLLTSSQFTRDKLRCHLYFLFEKPKSLDEMRAVCVGINTAKAQKLLDTAPYNPVQPDYISPPDCSNFQDPIPAHGRIAYSPGLCKYVPEDTFTRDLAAIIPQQWSTSGLVTRLADNWLATIKLHVGTEKGVNEPAFRAAAQLVHEVGRTEVIANINVYAKKLHDAAWEAILANGGRGDAADRKTYDVARFKQYLESATRPGKGFGASADEALRTITEAIDLCAQGSYGAIVDRTVIDAAIKLKEKHLAAWLVVKSIVKTKLKGIISAAEFDKLCRKQSFTTNINPSIGALTETPTGELVPFGPVDNENNLIWPVLSTYTFITNQDDNEYFVPPGEKDKVYPLNSELINFFYRDGLIRSSNNVTMHFGKKCLSVMFADRDNPVNSGIAFMKRLVGTRIVPLGHAITDGLWYNAGLQPDGQHKCALIKPEGVTLYDARNADVSWLPVAPNILPTDELAEKTFGNSEIATPRFLIDFYVNRINRYIACNDDDIPSLTSWLVTAMTNRPLAYIGEFIGPYNCGKSTGADLAKDLIDPALHTLGAGGSRSTFSGNVDDNFFSLLDSQQVTIIDNVGLLKASVQDILCQVSTGMRYNRRVLYTMNQQNMFIQKPLIFTGLDNVITRPDLISRTLTISFSRNPKFNPNFLTEWARDKPFFFGALLHITSQVMDRIKNIAPEQASRISQREIVIAAVSAVIKDSIGVDVDTVEQSNNQRYIEQIDTSNFCRMLTAFLGAQKSDEVLGTTNEIREKFDSWVHANLGRKVDLILLAPDGKLALAKEVSVTARDLPATPNAFGWALSKYTTALSQFSGWMFLPPKRSKNGMIRSFKRKKLLTDLW